VHSAIEFGNRLLTFVVALIAIATFLIAWRYGRTAVLRLAFLLALGVPAQAVIGGVTVLTDLNPWIVSLHLLVSLAMVGLAAFLGHVFPVWLRFHGGKGVATAAGVLIAFDWRMGLAVLVAWLAVAAASRYSSLGAIVAAVFAPVATWYFLGFGPFFAAVVVMGVVLIVRHKANIVKLLRGEESRIGDKKKQ